jgi:hypothetical protein
MPNWRRHKRWTTEGLFRIVHSDFPWTFQAQVCTRTEVGVNKAVREGASPQRGGSGDPRKDNRYQSASNWTSVGFISFNNGDGGNYALDSFSPYKCAAGWLGPSG